MLCVCTHALAFQGKQDKRTETAAAPAAPAPALSGLATPRTPRAAPCAVGTPLRDTDILSIMLSSCHVQNNCQLHPGTAAAVGSSAARIAHMMCTKTAAVHARKKHPRSSLGAPPASLTAARHRTVPHSRTVSSPDPGCTAHVEYAASLPRPRAAAFKCAVRHVRATIRGAFAFGGAFAFASSVFCMRRLRCQT